MADQMISMEVDGLDELQETFQDFVRKYPDRAGDLLVSQAKELRKDVIKLVKTDTDFHSSNKRSLSKAKEYKISKVGGYGENQFIEVSGSAPHFHLVENGHKLVDKNGKSVGPGWVVGYNFFDRAGKKRQIAIPKALETVVDKLLREEGLI